jgi:hypothetical protein
MFLYIFAASIRFQSACQDPFISHRTLAHTQGFVGQVAWYNSCHCVDLTLSYLLQVPNRKLVVDENGTGYQCMD